MTDKKIFEMEKVAQLVSAFKRAPYQKNKIYESDSEIFDLGLENNIAMTCDVLCEELEWQLISDPYIIGWVNVVSSLSDLAAVAAIPLGVLIGLSHPDPVEEEFLVQFWKGTQEALEAHQTFLLGGDTNISFPFLASCTGIGQCSKTKTLTRKGLNSGDLIYVSGTLGMGVATGFANFVIKSKSEPAAKHIEKSFKPRARINEAQIIAEYATSCIDTSDGLLAAIDFLLQINKAQAHLSLNKDHFHPHCVAMSKQMNIPLILFLSIHLGEFELLFSIPKNKKEMFESDMKKNSFSFYEIGFVDNSLEDLMLNKQKLDLAPIRNLLSNIKDPKVYLEAQQRWSEKNYFNF